jgi:hypothetical protein
MYAAWFPIILIACVILLASLAYYGYKHRKALMREFFPDKPNARKQNRAQKPPLNPKNFKFKPRMEQSEMMKDEFAREIQDLESRINEHFNDAIPAMQSGIEQKFSKRFDEMMELVRREQVQREELASHDAATRQQDHEILHQVSTVLLQMEHLPLAEFGTLLANLAASLAELRRVVEGSPEHSRK